MRFDRPNYPSNEFYSFKSGMPISDIEIQSRINHVIKYLEQHPNEQRSSTRSGNNAVVGIRYDNYIEIFVMSDYKHITLCDQDSK